MALNPEQSAAIDSMLAFLADGAAHFFLLDGPAGTGKTYCVQELINRVKGRLIFTAPTNKATKVLRDTLTKPEYRPECRTIYSLLGLRLEVNGEVKEITVPEDPVDLTQYKAVIVDEASMVNRNLMKFIRQTAVDQRIRFIFLGDASQLPPVGEPYSPVWDEAEDVAKLTTVVRHDNQILALATAIRKVIGHPAPRIKLDSNNADGEGVWRLDGRAFEDRIMDSADQGLFSKPNKAKAVSWRNVTVDALNRRIRDRIFDNPTAPWLPDDRVIVMEPAKDLEGNIIATTDDEGTVLRAEEGWHPVLAEFKVWRVSLTTDDNRTIVLQVLHEASKAAFERKSAEMASAAKVERRRWKDYWEFREAFHKLRHGYAITAHRAQGSTYEEVFVDWRDILLNSNKTEAFKCLYVACTRAKKRLYLN